jgi:hypothetical protein
MTSLFETCLKADYSIVIKDKKIHLKENFTKAEVHYLIEHYLKKG